jgi:hypothetical protein
MCVEWTVLTFAGIVTVTSITDVQNQQQADALSEMLRSGIDARLRAALKDPESAALSRFGVFPLNDDLMSLLGRLANPLAYWPDEATSGTIKRARTRMRQGMREAINSFLHVEARRYWRATRIDEKKLGRLLDRAAAFAFKAFER